MLPGWTRHPYPPTNTKKLSSTVERLSRLAHFQHFRVGRFFKSFASGAPALVGLLFMTTSKQYRSSTQHQRVKHIRAPQPSPSLNLVRFFWHALFPFHDLCSAHGANTTTAPNRTIVFLYDHLNLPISTIAGLTQEQAAKYRHMFRIDRPVRYCTCLRQTTSPYLPLCLAAHPTARSRLCRVRDCQGAEAGVVEKKKKP